MEQAGADEKYKLDGFVKLNWFTAIALQKELKKKEFERDWTKLAAIKNICKFLTTELKMAKKMNKTDKQKYKEKNIPRDINPSQFLQALKGDIDEYNKRLVFSILI